MDGRYGVDLRSKTDEAAKRHDCHKQRCPCQHEGLFAGGFDQADDERNGAETERAESQFWSPGDCHCAEPEFPIPQAELGAEPRCDEP